MLWAMVFAHVAGEASRLRRAHRLSATALLALVLGGCAHARAPGASSAPTPTPTGTGERYRPAATVLGGRAIGGLRCERAAAAYAFHLELFALGRGMVVPAGIGLAPPVRRAGAFVVPAGCRYPLSTTEPTGLVDVTPGGSRTLADLFALWGQPLSPTRLASFRGRVRAFVNGRSWRGDPRRLPLRPHAQITLEVGRLVAPHPGYVFPAGR
jgi:hypothetical protein